MKQFNIAEAKSHFSQIIQLALSGEEVVIARDNNLVSFSRLLNYPLQDCR